MRVQIQHIQDTLGQIQTNVARIEELHQQSLVNISDDQSNSILAILCVFYL
jgi:t-SNARE complex subunit (syntaxin)